MWLAKQAARAGADEHSPAGIAEITIGGASSAALGEAEDRELSILTLGGLTWLPEAGREALVLDCGGGDRVLVGQLQGAAPEGMGAGDVLIKAGDASVLIGADGSVTISGDITVSGDVALTGNASVVGNVTVSGAVAVAGSMTLNGIAVATVNMLTAI